MGRSVEIGRVKQNGVGSIQRRRNCNRVSISVSFAQGGFKLDNQHTLIKGYRDLSQAEIDLMNKIKEKGEELGVLCNDLMLANFAKTSDEVPDRRWVSVGQTHLQQGIMALVRSIAKPTTF